MTEAVSDSLSVADCLAVTGLTESTLADADADAEIWAHQEFKVVSNIIRRLGDRPGLGVDVGGFSTLGRLGVLGFAFLTSATIREGFERILPYQALLPSHMRFSIDSAHDVVVADDTDIPAEIRPFIVERDLAGLAAVLEGANIPVEVEWVETTLDEQRARHLAHTWSLTSDVRPNSAVNRIVGVPGALDMALPQKDPNTSRVFERQCRELLDGRLSRVGVAGQVRSRLLHDQSSFPSMQTIADELHLDPRTLRRRLTGEATSYRDVIAEVRRARAEQLLAGTDSIEVIACTLGYAETSSFTHAFKKWTGLAPSEFRRSVLSGRRRG